MILMTLIAVAMVGLLMVASAPDLSAFNATQRSRDLDLSLEKLRRTLSIQPLYLTSPPIESYSASQLHTALDRLTVKSQVAAHPDKRLAAGSSTLSTVPADPHVPAPNWFRAGGRGQTFWATGYNLIRGGNFAEGTPREAYDPGGFEVYFVDEGSGSTAGVSELYRVDRFGKNATSFRVGGVTEPAVSPDGSQVVFLADVPYHPGKRELYTSHSDGSIVEVLTESYLKVYEDKKRPIWSRTGSSILFMVEGTAQDQDLLKIMPATIREDGTGYSQKIINRGDWPGMEVFPGYAWGDGDRFIAYVYTRSGMVQPRLAIYDTEKGEHVMPPDGSTGPAAEGGLELSFAPGGTDLLFGTPGGGGAAAELYMLEDLLSYPVTSTPVLVSRSNQGPYYRACWFSRDVRAARNVTGRGIVFSGGPGSPGNARIYTRRARVNDPVSGGEMPSLPISPAGHAVEPRSLALSPLGVFVAYRIDGTGDVHLVAIDGTRSTLLHKPKTTLFAEAAVCIGPGTAWWTIPPGNAQWVDSRAKGQFDPQAFNDFLNAHSLYPGDNRFGSSFLRITSPGKQRHFLIDNGRDTYLIYDDPARRGTVHVPIKRIPDVNHSTWDPKGLTLAAKTVKSEVNLPCDVFKNTLDDSSATVVLLTTGINPTISSDGRWIAVSKYMTEVTTYPEPRVVDPIPDMDIWKANAVGAPEPREKNLTPNTKRSQERHPSWTPDGKYIYYQRETQKFTFHHAHESEIWRMSSEGGAHATVVSSGTMVPFWSQGRGIDTKIEAYEPCVSPDGGRLAFIGRERIYSERGKPGNVQVGDIISESIYILNLRNPNAYPVPILRSAIPTHPARNEGATANEDHSFLSLSWAANGQEVYAIRIKPMVRRFPEVSHEGAFYRPDQKDYEPATSSELIAIIPRRPPPSTSTSAGGEIDPRNDNFETIVKDFEISEFDPGDRLLHAVHSYGAYVYQYIDKYGPNLVPGGLEVNRPEGQQPYVLSAYLRTSPSSDHFQKGQVMALLLDDKGLLLSQEAGQDVFEVGIADSGGVNWDRFSTGIDFFSPELDGGNRRAQRVPVLLALYTLGPPGSWVEFTGIQLEDAYHPPVPFPTVFSPTWNVHSPSVEADPTRPGFYLFER